MTLNRWTFLFLALLAVGAACSREEGDGFNDGTQEEEDFPKPAREIPPIGR